MPERQETEARALGAEVDRLLAGEAAQLDVNDGYLGGLRPREELAVARRLSEIVASFPPVPAGLERRVREIVRSPPACRGFLWRPQARWRPSSSASAVGTATLSALATALVFLVVLFVVPALSGGQRSWADVMDVLLGQTRVRVTPTLAAPDASSGHAAGQADPTFVGQVVSAASSTPQPGAPPDSYPPASYPPDSYPRRELLRDLVAVELLIGRAPSIPKTLPQGYVLREIAAVSYPDLPSWISQPFYVELCYGLEAEGAPSDLRLRQYRLLFREFGGISGVQVASDAVRDLEQVDVGGVTGMLLTLDSRRALAPCAVHSPDSYPPDSYPLYTVLWERDGLLLELETDSLSQEHLLEIARSVR